MTDHIPAPRNGSDNSNNPPTYRLWPLPTLTVQEQEWLTAFESDMRTFAHVDAPDSLNDNALWSQMRWVDHAFKTSRMVDAPSSFKEDFMRKLAESGRKPPSKPDSLGGKAGKLPGKLLGGLNDLLGGISGKKLLFSLNQSLPTLIVLIILVVCAIPAVLLVSTGGIQSTAAEAVAQMQSWLQSVQGSSPLIASIIAPASTILLCALTITLLALMWAAALSYIQQRRQIYHVPITFHGA